MVFVDPNAISARIQNFKKTKSKPRINQEGTRREPREKKPRGNQEQTKRETKEKPEDSQRKAKATVRKYPPLKLTKTVPNEQIYWENPVRAI